MCYLCCVGRDDNDAHVVQLGEILSQCYGVLDNRLLAEQLHQYFVKHIYDSARQQPPMLTAAQARLHIEFHHVAAADARGDATPVTPDVQEKRDTVMRQFVMDTLVTIEARLAVLEQRFGIVADRGDERQQDGDSQ